MDIILQTQTDDPSLALIGVTRFADRSGYVAKLRVSSCGFILNRPFFFDDVGIADFVNALASMDKTLDGSAELRTLYHDDFIRLYLSPRGRVYVTGEVREYGVFDQFLHFGFETDQTVLRPFARDFEAGLHLDAM